MFALPWYSIVLISIPQVILIILIGFKLFNLPVDFKKCLATALLAGVITYFLRSSSVMPGIHTVLIILLISCFIAFLNKSNFLHSLAAVILGTMIMGVVEGVWCPLFLRWTGRTVNDLASYPWLNIAGFMPILLFTFVLYIFILKYDFVIYDLLAKGIKNEE